MNNEAHTHTVAHKDSNEYNMKMAKKLAFHFTRRSRKGIKRNACNWKMQSQTVLATDCQPWQGLREDCKDL